MNGVWLENGVVSLRDDLPHPNLGENEAIIRVLCAGICSTDHGLISGMFPYVGVIGHEFVGVVEEGPESVAGRRVVGEIVAACRQCAVCQKGRTSHCPHRTVLGITNRNGAFADYTSLPAENLHVVPESVSTEIATFTEPLAAALQILEQVHITSEDRVLVVGSGKLGQLIARTLMLTRCSLTGVGRNRRTLDLFPQHVEVMHVEQLPDVQFDVVVECTGNTQGFDIARRAVRPRGTLVLKSTYPGSHDVDFTSLVVDEVTLVGSRCGPFAKAIRLLESCQFDLSTLIDHTFPLSQAVEALSHSRKSGTLKVLLDMQGSSP
jgi:threonine dehydrogenase-like Zn-dependent dehydrogenase